MKILIVEDEQITRMGLAKTIENEESFKVVGECSNGKQALEQVKKHPDIDIILLDLNMPIMDGLEFMDHLDPNYQGKVIVLSSYDDLEHIKEAMKKGAADYFHKPTMSPHKIISMLKEAGTIQKDTPNLQTEEWIKQLIYNPSEPFLHCTDHWITSKQSVKAVILLSINDFNLLSISNYEVRRLLEKWKRVTSFQGELVSYKEGQFLLIEPLKTPSQLNQFYYLQKICASIQEYSIQAKQLSVSFGISESTNEIRDLKKYITHAEQALKNEFFSGRGSITFYQNENNIVDEHCPSLDKIWKAFEQWDQHALEKSLEEYFLTLKSMKDRDQVIILAIELKMELKRRMEKFQNNFEALNILPQSVVQLAYFSDVKNDVMSDFLKVFNWLLEFENKKFSPMVRYVLQFLNKNYSKDISLDSLASLVQTNPSYLSRVFKKQTGHKISDYIANLRIERAKELLSEQHLRTKDVALAVGYENERYFSQIFKKLTGLPPSIFRKQK